MEAIIQDFSGGMNSSVAVDKLDAKECLLAENVRFDEKGNILITGANTLQNTSALNGSVHSEFLDSALGAIAGAGTNVYTGADFTGLQLSGVTNPSGSKISFGNAPNRIYMDLGGTGYLKDSSVASLITVDWAPPTSGGQLIAGPSLPGTGIASGGGIAWVSPNNITSTNTASVASAALTVSTFSSNQLLATNFGFAVSTASTIQGIQLTVVANNSLSANAGAIVVVLLKGGVPVGASGLQNLPTALSTLTFGGPTYLWGSTWAPADVNAVSFGFRVIAISNNHLQPVTVNVDNGQLSIYGGASVGTVAGTGAAGTLTGTYSWKVAFTGPNGEESQASMPTNTQVLSAQQGTLTSIPVGDSRTGGRNIYRKGGTLSSYYLVGQIADNSSTTFADNQTDLAALTQGTILAGDVVGDEPNTRLGSQTVKYATYHYDRVFWAVGNLLIWSKPLNGFAYPADFSTPVGDAKGITGIFSMGGELFLLKPDSVYRLSGTDENSFVLSKTLSPVGTDWPFTAVLSGGATSGFFYTGRILFANSRGLWAFNGYTSNKVTPKLDLWFRQDDRTNVSLFGVNGFKPPEISNAAVTALFHAAANPSFYYWAYAEAGQTTLNSMLVLDIERGTISKRSFRAQSIIADLLQGYVYAGDALGNIVKLDDWNATNNGLGNAVNFDFQDGYRDMKLRGSWFALWGIDLLINTSGQQVTPTIYYNDGEASETLAPISTTLLDKRHLTTNSARSRQTRNFSIRLNASSSAVNASGKSAIQLQHLKIYYEPRGARARTGEKQ